MDDNLRLLLILAAVAAGVGLFAALLGSHRVRHYGLLGALRRKFSGGSSRSPYGN